MFTTRNGFACVNPGRRVTALATLAAALCMLSVALLAAPRHAEARVHSVTATKVRGGVATFRLKGIVSKRIRSPHLSGVRKRSLSLRQIRVATRRGVLRVRISNRHAGAWRKGHVRQLRLIVETCLHVQSVKDSKRCGDRTHTGTTGTSGPTGPTGPSGTTGTTAMPVGDLLGWRQVFADDFNGSSLDTTKWYEPYDSPSHHWDPSHVTVANGLLNIDAYKDAHNDGYWWSSGVNGGEGLKQTYGKYEVRFRMDAGRGISDALMVWLVGCWPPEIDFAESAGNESLSRPAHAGFLHYQGPGGCNDDRRIDAGEVNADFTQWHTIGVEWTPGKLVYTLDGAPWSTIQDLRVPANPAELVLQTQSCNPICPDATTPAHVNMQVDWVVAYAPVALL